jgi:phospholipid-transporting ATPase
MEKVADKIEQGFKLLGSTAIEDKLQDEVEETLEQMKEAGIKVWILTGDKIETAINIGYSCKLLDNQIKHYLIDGKIVERVFE